MHQIPVVFAVVLAAGLGSLLGGGRLLLDIGGLPMLVHAAGAALDSGASRTVLVLGHDAPEAEAVLRRYVPARPGIETVHN